MPQLTSQEYSFCFHNIHVAYAHGVCIEVDPHDVRLIIANISHTAQLVQFKN
jgi:hypothetical protein